MAPEPQLVRLSDAALRLGLSYWTLWRAARLGTLPTVEINGRRYVRAEDVQRIAREGLPTRGPRNRGGR